MEKEKPRSFRLSSSEPMFEETAFGDMSQKGWWKFRKMSRKEYRNTAGLCLLLGFLMPILFWFGVLSGIVWIYKVIRKEE